MELYSKNHAVCRLLIMDNMVYSVLVFFLFDFRCELNVGTRHAVSVSVEKLSRCMSHTSLLIAEQSYNILKWCWWFVVV